MATDLQAAATEAADCLFMTLAPFPVDESRNLKAARRLLAAAERVLSDEAIVTAAERSGATVLEGYEIDMLRQFAKELMK